MSSDQCETEDNRSEELSRLMAVVQYRHNEAAEKLAGYDESAAHYQLSRILWELEDYFYEDGGSA